MDSFILLGLPIATLLISFLSILIRGFKIAKFKTKEPEDLIEVLSTIHKNKNKYPG